MTRFRRFFNGLVFGSPQGPALQVTGTIEILRAPGWLERFLLAWLIRGSAEIEAEGK